MAPYSMDLRKRIARAWDAGEDAETIAETYAVSRAWVHRLIQRRRETGSLAPRKQTVFKKTALAGREETLRALVTARPDQTLAELRDALALPVSVSSIWRALDRLKLTVKKNGTRRRTGSAGRRRGAAALA